MLLNVNTSSDTSFKFCSPDIALVSGSGSWDGHCVKDRQPRLLGKYLGKSNGNTPSDCVRRCKELDDGYLFAGVQFGSECFCGNEAPPDDTLVDESECDWKCEGDNDLVCGALWRMNVYETGCEFIFLAIIFGLNVFYSIMTPMLH